MECVSSVESTSVMPVKTHQVLLYVLLAYQGILLISVAKYATLRALLLTV